MAKTLTETPISTRNARSKLEPGIYFKGIDREVHLGYRKGARGGVWFVRWRAERVPAGAAWHGGR